MSWTVFCALALAIGLIVVLFPTVAVRGGRITAVRDRRLARSAGLLVAAAFAIILLFHIHP